MKAETKAITKTEIPATPAASVPAAAIKAQLNNDWSGVSDEDKVRYACSVCKALDIPTPLNPFKFIAMKGKTVFYATKEAAELIAERNRISVNVTNKYLDKESNIYVVEVRAAMKDGRTLDNFAALSMAGKTGEDRANAMMKTMSKALRRAVFAAVGLSVMDDEDLAAIGDRAYPTPPPLVRPVLAQVITNEGQKVPEKDAAMAEETIEARAQLFKRLVAEAPENLKSAQRVKWAKEFIQEHAGKPLELLSADDCMDVEALFDTGESEGNDLDDVMPPEEPREPGDDEQMEIGAKK